MTDTDPDPTAQPTQSYEQAIEHIETIIDRIESGEVGLEEAIRQSQQGMKLIRHCRTILDQAEKKISELGVDDSGQLKPASDDSQA